jgi:hypothetical protein
MTPSVMARTRDVLEAATKPVLTVAAVASLAWNLVLLRVAKDELGMLLWVQRDSTIFPSPLTQGHALPFEFQGARVRSARLLDLRLMNAGKSMIGDAESVWTVKISAPDSARLTLVHAPVVTPASTVLRSVPDSSARHIELQIGAFQSRATVDLSVLLLDAAETAGLRLESSLPGLPNRVTNRSPQAATGERLWFPLFIFCLLALPLLLSRLIAKDLEERRGSQIGWYAVKGLFAFAFMAGIISFGLAKVVAWIVGRLE